MQLLDVLAHPRRRPPRAGFRRLLGRLAHVPGRAAAAKEAVPALGRAPLLVPPQAARGAVVAGGRGDAQVAVFPRVPLAPNMYMRICICITYIYIYVYI